MSGITPSSSKAIALIGAPTDIGGAVVGSYLAPAALRAAGLAQALGVAGRMVQDRGDISGPAQPVNKSKQEGVCHLPEVAAWSRAVREAVGLSLEAGQLPVLLGGDHSLSMGSVGAVAAYVRGQGKKLRILWLDAHADFNTPAITPSGNMHGMVAACINGWGPNVLLDICAPGARAAVDKPTDFCLIGVRDWDEEEKKLLECSGIGVWDMGKIQEMGMAAVLAQALQGVDENTHIHLSLDVDFLDPEIAPGVGVRVAAGPSRSQAQECMAMIAATGQLASLDLTECNPLYDPTGKTVQLMVELTQRVLGEK